MQLAKPIISVLVVLAIAFSGCASSPQYVDPQANVVEEGTSESSGALGNETAAEEVEQDNAVNETAEPLANTTVEGNLTQGEEELIVELTPVEEALATILYMNDCQANNYAFYAEGQPPAIPAGYEQRTRPATAVTHPVALQHWYCDDLLIGNQTLLGASNLVLVVIRVVTDAPYSHSDAFEYWHYEAYVDQPSMLEPLSNLGFNVHNATIQHVALVGTDAVGVDVAVNGTRYFSVDRGAEIMIEQGPAVSNPREYRYHAMQGSNHTWMDMQGSTNQTLDSAILQGVLQAHPKSVLYGLTNDTGSVSFTLTPTTITYDITFGIHRNLP